MWLFLSFVPLMPPTDIITITIHQQHYSKKQHRDLDSIEMPFCAPDDSSFIPCTLTLVFFLFEVALLASLLFLLLP